MSRTGWGRWLSDRIAVDPGGMGGIKVGSALLIPWWRRPKDTLTLHEGGFVRYGHTIAWGQIETIRVGMWDGPCYAVIGLVIETAETEISISEETEGYLGFLTALESELGIDMEPLNRLTNIPFLDEWAVLYRRETA